MNELNLDFLGSIQIRQDYQDTSKPASLLNNEILNEYEAIIQKSLVNL